MRDPNLPTLQEELDRKVHETLTWLIHGLEIGRITKTEFSTSIDALFMAVSGLVENDFIQIITEAQKMCEENK